MNIADEWDQLCTNCEQRPGSHRSAGPAGAHNLCCDCHIASGGIPADWHSRCVALTAIAKAENDAGPG